VTHNAKSVMTQLVQFGRIASSNVSVRRGRHTKR
jgi:hypothetical protein